VSDTAPLPCDEEWWRDWSERSRAPALVEGLDYDGQAPELPTERRAWTVLYATHEAVRRGAPTANAPVLPAPLSDGELARLVATLIHPRTGPVLAEALLRTLGSGLGRLVARLTAPKKAKR
jgi:hypothetical protein